MIITLKGRVPSKKNSTITIVRKGRVLHFPQNAYRTWHKNASAQIAAVVPSTMPRFLNADVEIIFYAPDARKTDLSNKAESIMDLLVDTKVLTDDNWDLVKSLSLRYGGIDRINPRAEITIKSV